MSNYEFSHYYKQVNHLYYIDIYRILKLYEVTDPCIQHAIKKLLVAGGRGVKDVRKDFEEARASIDRALNMMLEDEVGSLMGREENNG